MIKNSKLLIVDDVPEILHTFERLLKLEMDVEIIIAASGKEAMKTFLHHDFALIILDVKMPEMSGFELAEILRSNDDTKHIPIIFVTGIYKEDDFIFKGYKTGAVDYLIKPFNTEHLISKVRVFVQLDQRKKEIEEKNRQLVMEITARKQLEIEMTEYRENLEKLVKERTGDLHITNAELTRANRLKDEFLANMSHELRTPLTAILGMSEALVEQVYGSLNEKQLKSLRRVESSGQHLLNLINDILDLSKIEAGKIDLEIIRVFVDEVCQASMQIVRDAAQKKNQKLFLSIDSRLKFIQADMLRLKQILVNLLMNAVKFTPERGKISLKVNCKPEQNIVEFAVRDTGIGISDEDINKLFQPFVQLDGSFTRERDGTGLGLSLVYKLVDLHGGSVNVESETGIYTRFAVMLPWSPDTDLQALKNHLPRVMKTMKTPD
ncbi:hybrid sensor histidine kinase/response regulator [Desulfobacterales bacterium HSG17]|nr:hybrid sensor histidine kinase/response regulator [Desulfobacterales bacterium HSG17]